jgi:hypothetical protein
MPQPFQTYDGRNVDFSVWVVNRNRGTYLNSLVVSFIARDDQDALELIIRLISNGGLVLRPERIFHFDIICDKVRQ